jgi:hypothetical protein
MNTDSNNSLGSEENEDLFDFQLVGAYATQSQQAEKATEATPEAAPVESPVEAHVESPVEAPVAKTAPVAQDTSDLDEDLFNFKTSFESSQTLTSAEDSPDLGAMLEQHEATNPAPVAPAPSSAPNVAAPAPAAAPTAQTAPQDSAPQAASASRMSVPSDIPASMWAAPMAAPALEPKRGRLVEVLALCFLVLNTALVLFAWRASDDFRDTLTVVTATVSDAVADGHTRGQVQNASTAQDTQGSVGVTPDVQAAQVKTADRISDDPSNLVLLPRATLDLAIDRIAQGKFQIARQGLFHLLANQDRTALTEAMVVEAEALIADAFSSEAQEIQE